MYKTLLFLFFVFGVISAYAQKPVPLGITFDCATKDTIYAAGIPGCDSLIVTGISNYKVKSCVVSFEMAGSLREVICQDPACIKGILSSLVPGKQQKPGKLFMEKVVIVPVKGGKDIRLNKLFRFYIKSS